MKFTNIRIPTGDVVHIPSELRIIAPEEHSYPGVPREFLHSLTYIPWDETYLSHVPSRYRDFYRAVVPRLNARSTDVHTALSVSYVDELIRLSGKTVDQHILTIAVLLHDIGWAQLTPAQIALSLNYSAFAYTEEALLPKRLHATLGADEARKVLDEFRNELSLDQNQIDFVVRLVRFHDQIDPWPEKPEPIEYLLLGDADRLWSYTRENFWLDTIRKNTTPRVYIKNITDAIDDYFLTDAGKIIARRLASEREQEVSNLETSVGKHEMAAAREV